MVKAWFNASSILHKGKRWLAYRTECKRWFTWSRISLVQLDAEFSPIPETNRLLDLHTRFDNWGAEDPKLFLFKGDMYLSYGDGYRMLLAELDDKGNVVRSGPVPADAPDMNPPQAHPREKNWGFFELDGRLFCQKDVAPTVTYEFDPTSWKIINQWTSNWKWRTIYGHRVNGASPPVLHDGKLWRWVHSHRPETIPGTRKVWWSDKPLVTANRYYPHLLCFKAEPPFDPIAISEKPIFTPPWEPQTTVTPTWHATMYVGSAEREGDGWRIFYGENDCRVVTAHFPDQEAHATLVESPVATPKTVKPKTKGHLHFIWMQGFENLPASDKVRVEQWTALNPEWQTTLWDQESLRKVIAEKAPVWLKPWDELQAQAARSPADKALVAKASDLGRLILLNIRFDGEQTWNAYADTDTTPYRPLSDFLNDESKMGANFPKHSVISVSPSDQEWNSNNFDLIVTQENLLTPSPSALTNAVMLARPGAGAITALLREGMSTRGRSTLKSFGPIMLRQTIEALRRTPEGRRIEILPFHYLVWNPAQMSMERPAWTVCAHHNEFRWFQPGVKTSHAGTSRKRILT